jgi:hypothetical protein
MGAFVGERNLDVIKMHGTAIKIKNERFLIVAYIYSTNEHLNYKQEIKFMTTV